MTTPSRPPGRYDEKAPLSGPAKAVGGAVLVLALTGASFLAYQRYSDEHVAYTVRESRVVSDSRTDVRFALRKDAGERVRCLLNAVDADRVEVGTSTFVADATVKGTTTFTVAIMTSRRATAGQVLSCRRAD